MNHAIINFYSQNKVKTSSESLILDIYSSNIVAAFSLRKLSSSYTGAAIQVKRTSDDTTQDIGFVGNDLDTTAISTFCSGTTGSVSIWYDQSGFGRHATASGEAAFIYAGGTVSTNGSKVAVDATSQTLQPYILTGSDASGFTFSNSIVVADIFTTSAPGGGGNGNYYTEGAGTGDISGLWLRFNSPFATGLGGYDGANYGGLSQTGSLDRNIAYTQVKSSKLYASLNSNADAEAVSTFNTLRLRRFLGRGNNFNIRAHIQEAIFYNQDQTSNKSGLLSNINSYWSVY
jgi:hypothetical protein